jgi:hypothetical protein
MFKVRSRKPKPGTSTDPALCRAVGERRRLRCTYGDAAERLLEPHCHGHGKEGQELLSAYQVAPAGGSAAGWKMFDARTLVVVAVTDERFEPRADFNPELPGMTQVHCRVGQ